MTQTLPIAINLNVERGLASYIQTVNTMPVLSADEEHALALRYTRDGDLEAAQQLILSHLRYVVRIARGLAGYGLPQADLIQEGNIGLMKAVKHFDPMRGVRLVSFAVHWIRAEIYDFILRNWRIVKVATTKAQRKLFFNLRKTRARLGWMKPGEVDAMAEDLDVPADTVMEMEGRLSGADVPFDIGDESDDDSFYAAPAGYLQDMRYNPEQLITAADQETDRQDRIQSALSRLDARSRDIIQRRWLSEKKPTLTQLARKYKISAERVRQIEQKALTQMKDVLSA